MATTTPLTDSIEALTTYANETTGASDSTLSEAVATLVSGYGSGSSSIQSGTFTLSSASKTFTVTLTEEVTIFVFYAEDYPAGTASAGWHTVGGFWVNSEGKAIGRYNEANTSLFSMTVTASSTSFKATNSYNLLADKTFYWYAW